MIDVLVPYYGDPALMRLAMRSVLTQDVAPARIIVVDDGYPERWLEPWLLEQPEVRAGAELTYVRNDPNLGARENYTKALSLATSDYVVVMGADDVMEPNFVSRATELAAVHRPAIIQSGVRVIDEEGRAVRTLVDLVKARTTPRSPTSRVLGGEKLAASLLRGNWAYFPALVWHRETITQIGFRGYDIVQDLGLLIDVIRAGGELVLDPEVTFNYRRHSGSDSSLKTLGGSRFAEERDYFDAVAADLAAQGWNKAARAARLHWTSRAHAAALAGTALASRDGRAAGRALKHTLNI